MKPVKEPSAANEKFEGDMERLSLEQALIDFEVANKRVVDLTNRLVEALEENRVLRRQLEMMHVRHYLATRLRRFGPWRGFVRTVRGRKSRP